MPYYFDSSAAVKRYAPEQGSVWVRGIMPPAEKDTIYLAQVGVVGITAALGRKVHTGELAQEDQEAALRLFLEDVRNKIYLIAPLSDVIVETCGGVNLATSASWL